MSYRIYTTEGFILGAYKTGEANFLLKIYTRDLGMVYASAQGVRLMKSKLRYSLQQFSYLGVSLVRGKGGWRVTNASFISNPYLNILESKNKQAVFLNIFSLLDRLVKGEERDERLFSVLVGFIDSLHSSDESGETVALIEILAVLRILETQGVRKHYTSLDGLVKSDVWGEGAMEHLGKHRRKALFHINHALKNLQL